jgi:hypothetical protein
MADVLKAEKPTESGKRGDGMTPIAMVTLDGTLLAHHTTEHPLSTHDTLIWSVEATPEEGDEIFWTQGEDSYVLTVVGVVAGCLVVKEENGLLVAIIWRDGKYRAGLMVDRETGEPAPADADLPSGEYTVRGVVPLPGSILGAVLS